MIETVESRAEFEKRREKAKAAMKAAIRGELPFSSEVTLPDEVIVPDGVTLLSAPKGVKVTLQPGEQDERVTQPPKNKLRNRAEYMREYRKRPKACPHCGQQI